MIETMIVAFFESLKYVGHLYPVALLRLYFGFTYFYSALEKVEGEYLQEPRLAGAISQWMPRSTAPNWYKDLLENFVVPNWQVFAYVVTYVEFLVAISLIIGFAVRPVSLIGLFLAMNYAISSNPDLAQVYHLHMIIFLTLTWLGAGRCLGFDYFFYKRKRGIWW